MFRVELDGFLQHQMPYVWTAMLSATIPDKPMLAPVPAGLASLLAGTFFRGWQRLDEHTFVIIQSTMECARLSTDEELVSVS